MTLITTRMLPVPQLEVSFALPLNAAPKSHTAKARATASTRHSKTTPRVDKCWRTLASWPSVVLARVSSSRPNVVSCLSSRGRVEARRGASWWERGRKAGCSAKASGGREAAGEARRRYKESVSCIHLTFREVDLRPPRPGNPGAPGKPGNGGGAPPTPAAGPASEIGAAAPRPAGRATPGPAVSVEATPPPDLPRRALGSAGGGDSTDSDTIWAPRTIVRPRVRFSSCSITCPADDDAPGAEGLFCLRLTRRNSSVSARTRFMCCLKSASRRVERMQTNAIPCQRPTSDRSSGGHR